MDATSQGWYGRLDVGWVSGGVLVHAGGRVCDYVLVNTAIPQPELLERYRASGQDLVLSDVDRIRQMGYKVITGNFISQTDYVRHDPHRLAEAILRLAK